MDKFIKTLIFVAAIISMVKAQYFDYSNYQGYDDDLYNQRKQPKEATNEPTKEATNEPTRTTTMTMTTTTTSALGHQIPFTSAAAIQTTTAKVRQIVQKSPKHDTDSPMDYFKTSIISTTSMTYTSGTPTKSNENEKSKFSLGGISMNMLIGRNKFKKIWKFKENLKI